jgi:hypothetical protein
MRGFFLCLAHQESAMFFGRNGEHKAAFGSIAQKTPAVLATRARLNRDEILTAQTKKCFLHRVTRRLDIPRDFLGVTDKNTLKALDCTWDDFSAVMGGFNRSTLKAEFY